MSNPRFRSTLLAISAAVFLTCFAYAQSPGNPAEGYVKADDGTKLFYQKWGTGKQMVIIPAGFLLGDDFARLASRRTVIMYDMRNRGRSDSVSDPAHMTVQDDVRDLEAIRRHFGAERFSTVGYSYLGKMIMLYALAHPDRLERAVQMGPVAMKWDTEFPPSEMNKDDEQIVDGAAWAELQKLTKEGYDKQHPREFCEKQWNVLRVRLVGNQANVDKLGPSRCDYKNEWPAKLAQHFEASFASIKKEQLEPSQVAKIRIPVLTIHGTKDRNAPYGSGKQWAANLPDARLITVDGAAHNVWIDEPKVIDWIDQFFAGKWPEQARKISPGSSERAAR